MNPTKDLKKVLTPIKNPDKVHIPTCCTSGDPTCKHCINPDKTSKKRNIAV